MKLTPFDRGLIALFCGLTFMACAFAWNENTNGPNPVPSASASPSPSPSASAAACRPADTVRVGFFGFDCAPGVTPPSNGGGVLPLGCTGALTATPKVGGEDQQGRDHEGVIPAWRVASGDGFVSLVSRDQPFNRTAVPLAVSPAGTVVVVEATVCGVAGTTTFRVTP
jgi:hypothetical protein